MLMDGGMDRQTKDRQKVIIIAHPEHSSGELKMAPLDSRFFAFKEDLFSEGMWCAGNQSGSQNSCLPCKNNGGKSTKHIQFL